MRCIETIQEAFGDRCTYIVDDAEVVMRPYYGFADRDKFEMREAVLVGSYANGQPKYQFVTRKDGIASVTVYHSIGD